MYFARTVLVLLLAGAIGLVGYQIGLSQAVATAAPPPPLLPPPGAWGWGGPGAGLRGGAAPAAPAAGAVPMAYPYWYGPGFFGFGFFGFLFPLFFLFLFFGLLRAAFGGGRGGHWGGQGRWMNGRDRIEQIHRGLHGEKPARGGGAGAAAPPPAPETPAARGR